MHLSMSTRTLKTFQRENSPRSAPSGQTYRHQNRSFFALSPTARAKSANTSNPWRNVEFRASVWNHCETGWAAASSFSP